MHKIYVINKSKNLEILKRHKLKKNEESKND